MGSWGEQFSTGDQSNDSRNAFYESSFKKCMGCGVEGAIDSKDHVAGCRHNGDGYGTTVFTCTKCRWSTSFQYDEAGDCYYYEVRITPDSLYYLSNTAVLL